MESSSIFYRIGQVARRVDMSVEGLRFYDRSGLVRPRRRSLSGYRLYDEEQVEALRFVRAAQEMGFSLAEIREMLELRRGRAGGCEAMRERLSAKLERVRERIRLLRLFERQLAEAVRRCERQLADGDPDRCPVLDELGRGLASEPPSRKERTRR